MKTAKERAAGSEKALLGDLRERRVAEEQLARVEPYLDKAEARSERRVTGITEPLYPLALEMLRGDGYTVEDHRIPCYPEGFQWSWTISW